MDAQFANLLVREVCGIKQIVLAIKNINLSIIGLIQDRSF